MTTLLQKAFDAAANLSAEEQDLLASRILAEIAADREFDQAIAATGGKLPTLAMMALSEFRRRQR